MVLFAVASEANFRYTTIPQALRKYTTHAFFLMVFFAVASEANFRYTTIPHTWRKYTTRAFFRFFPKRRFLGLLFYRRLHPARNSRKQRPPATRRNIVMGFVCWFFLQVFFAKRCPSSVLCPMLSVKWFPSSVFLQVFSVICTSQTCSSLSERLSFRTAK